MRPEKQQLAEDIRHLVEPSPFVFLVNYKGLTVHQFEDLRTRLDDCQAQCHVVPNRLLRQAVRNTDSEILAEQEFRGETAIITGSGDVVTVAKTVSSFLEDKESVTVKGGALTGASLSGEDVAELAKLPSREVLLGTLLGVLNGPARNLVGTLAAAKSGLVYVLQAFVNKQEGNA